MSRLGLLAVLTAAAALTTAACSKPAADGPGPSPTPVPVSGSDPVSYTAVGASDAAGVGASVPCLPFTACPDGTGYVPVVARSLRTDGHTVTLTNIGLPGAVLSPAIQQLGNRYGLGIQANFLEQEAPFVPRDTTLLTVFAGGNDTNTVATAIDRGEVSAADANAYIDGQIDTFRSDYRSLVSIVRSRAPNARLVVLNLPNLAGLPYMAGRTAAEKRWTQRLSVGFSARGANELTAGGAAVIDLLCDPRSYQASNYSSDGFHPNDAGYAFIAAEVLRAAEAASWPAPAASCAQMTLID
jgi:lysophospholipase L1-like esterase